MNNTFEKLKSVFQELRNAEIAANYQFGVDRLNHFFFDAESNGDFTKLPPKEQIRLIGGGVLHAYLGKGQMLIHLTDGHYLPDDFPDNMRLAAWFYFLTLDISEEDKNHYREEIERIPKS